MATDWFTPLNSLRDLPGSALRVPTRQPLSPGDDAENDPSLSNFLLQDQLKSEAEDRANAAMRGGDPSQAAALTGLKDIYQRDMANSPITVQAGQVGDTLQRQRMAKLAGFNSPEEAAYYQRQQEEAKLRQPMDIEKMKGQSAMDVARQQAGSAKDVAEINADWRKMTAENNQYKDILNFLSREDAAQSRERGLIGQAAIRAGGPGFNMLQENIASGRLDQSDPNVKNALAEMNARVNRFTGSNSAAQVPGATPQPSDGAPIEKGDANTDARQLIGQVPGRSLQEYLALHQRVFGGFASEADQQIFTKALQRLGIK